ncbi:hypothetical protein [Streptosporangium carneum]|uniref:Uncharacterized protein n=1 Tax=Streptosporangium carneum TaxID=47481 RepID=A0A9W6I9A8_9ACTN|nr:hypothetical protein [Streptosporangium carneum]GLK14152.1 hypothetical protein GCM10017600_75640 [Streptosporangium carneum]
MDPGVIVGAAGAIAGLVSTVYTARQARKAEQDKEAASERAALRQVEQGAYQRASAFDVDTQARMQAEIARQSEQIRTLQRQAARLTRQITQVGLVPDITEEDEHA